MGSIITLTTDFGLVDGYHGVIEGIIAGINPEARVISVSHAVDAMSIAGGWYLLKSHHRYFPAGTVHMAVVDPGVGSGRQIIAVATEKYKFIAPDNGLLSFIPEDEIISIHAVTNRDYALREISPVFHGRDIIAPAAAYLSRGVDPACLGEPVQEMVQLYEVEPVIKRDMVLGRVIWVDKFGNLVTNIEAGVLVEKYGGLDNLEVTAGGQKTGEIQETFSDVETEENVAYIGSGGHLEIAVRDDSAFELMFPDLPDEIVILVEPTDEQDRKERSGRLH